ncbi:ewing's tumor-associated antigen 1 [Stegostoma tigrinum]|uniref:ewing's tumor-associated antigen 1 n=1 Tax=Stegostoma tigrinum TaxID=3053191 RepID=UPI00202AE353|nr:ewing's tumor-associated antigen 1 [Stegostoma tigrinum]
MKKKGEEDEATSSGSTNARPRRTRLHPSPGPSGERGAGPGLTPPARTGRLSRGSRSAARPRAPEEILSNKTPKRILKKQQLIANHNSPVNDNELQQDIYWDQHSPTTFKLGTEKKSIAGQHAVEISDIVKRIAPQRSSEVPLNIWLGEDAIQCSPTISFRERIKTSNSRFQRSTDEELMKLAKEFDRNMVEQDVGCGQEASEVDWTSDCADLEQTPGAEQLNCERPALGQIPVTGITGPVKGGAGGTLPVIELHNQNSSQEALDLEAEAAVNALFDGPTQHTGRPLSQGFSGNDTSSPKLEESCVSEVISIPAQRAVDPDKGTNTAVVNPVSSCLTGKLPSALQALKPLENDAGSSTFFDQAASSKHDKGFACEAITTVCELDQQGDTNAQFIGKAAAVCTSETIPEDDGFDDWENDDWMAEDSFIMQITQNPELIATPKECKHLPNQSSHTLNAANQNGTNKFNASTNLEAAPAIVPSVSFAQQVYGSVHKPKDSEMIAKTLQFEKGSERSKPRATFALQSKSIDKVSEQAPRDKIQQSNVFEPVVNALIKNEQRNSEVPRPQCNSHLFNGSRIESTSFTHTIPFNQQTLYSVGAQKSTKNSFVSLSSSVLAKSLDQLGSGKPSSAGSPRRVGTSLQSAPAAMPADDWNDENFSDEIQNMFTELDSQWEIGDDDDDLNRMCDDVEKLIQSQDSGTAIISEAAGLDIANSSQSITNNAILSLNIQKHQFTERLEGQQKHFNYDQSAVVSESKVFRGQLAAKQSNAPYTKHLLRPTDLTGLVCSAATLPTQSHHLNSLSSFQDSSSSSTTTMCAMNLNRTKFVPASRTGAGISNLLQASVSTNLGHSHKLSTCTTAVAHTAGTPRTPQFNFTKITNSSVMGTWGNTSSHIMQRAKTFGNKDHEKSPMERNVQSSTFSTATQCPAAPLKRHFSDSSLQTKVMEKPVAKCSLQEIEQKKLAALARRKMKMQASDARSSFT